MSLAVYFLESNFRINGGVLAKRFKHPVIPTAQRSGAEETLNSAGSGGAERSGQAEMYFEHRDNLVERFK
jgi:hypothetical protein